MSTYTDLHNRVKENVTVDYNNRITTQRARFLNEQNEYWGTLRGNVSAENINIAGGTLSGVTLVDTILDGSLALPDGIDLHKVLQQVSQISTDLLEAESDIANESKARKQAVEAEKDRVDSLLAVESNSRNAAQTYISGVVDQTNKDFKRELTTLSAALTDQDLHLSSALSIAFDKKLADETAARASADTALSNDTASVSAAVDYVSAYLSGGLADYLSATVDVLSSAIDKTNANLGGEVFDRKIVDDKLAAQVKEQALASQTRDQKLADELTEHAAESKEQLSYAHAEMLSTVEHERHYTINNGTATAKTTDSWPYKAQDFAVNVYKPTVSNGAVSYVDSDGKKYEVGQVFKAKDCELYPFTFKTLAGIEHPGVASALNDNWPYGFDTAVKAQPTLLNGYSLQFVDTAASQELSDFTFEVAPTLPQFHKIMNGDLMVGKVTDAYPADYYEDLVSGKIWFDTLDSELETFNKFRKVEFNKTDLSVCTKETERVTYLGENKFKLEKNIDTSKFIGIYDSLDEKHTQFGRVYELYNNISGIVCNSDGIETINVCLSNPYSKLLSLSKANGFRNVISSGIKQGDAEHDIVLSAAVDGMSATFDQVKVSELYKYDFDAVDSDGKQFVGGYVVPKQYNKKISDSRDFTEAEVDVSKLMWISAFKKTYTLTKAADESLWTAEVTDDDSNVLNIMFNGETLFVKVTSGTDGNVFKSKHTVKVNEPQLFNADECHVHIYTSGLVDLSKYGEVFESPIATYNVTIDSAVTTESFPRYTLGIDTSDTSTLKIQVPERKTLDIAREFMVIIKPDCFFDKLVKLDFVKADGTQAQFTCNRRDMLLIPTNKWTTLQVKEIDNNIFYVLDLDGNENDHDVEFLSAAISSESDVRAAQDKFLSDELVLSAASLQEQVVSNDNDISYLSSELGFMLSVDKESMTYKGTLPKLLNLSDAISNEDLGYNYLSTFIGQVAAIHADGRVKLGDFFKLSAMQSCLYDASHEQVWLGAQDYFVINKDIAISDVKAEDIDIFRNAESEFSWLSAALCAEIDALSTSLSTDVDKLSAALSNDIDSLSTALSTDIDSLSAALSTDIDDLSTALSAEISSLDYTVSVNISDEVKQLQDQIDSNDNDIAYVSSEISANDSDITFLSAEISANDSDITFLSGQHDDLQSQVISNDSDITFLSGQHDDLQSQVISNDSDIEFLSSEVSANDNDIEFLSGEVSANDSDITFLSNDLSTLEHQHYNKNLSNDIALDHKYYDITGSEQTITHVVDQLLIVDEVTFDRYRLTIRNGSLNINKVDSVIPAV